MKEKELIKELEELIAKEGYTLHYNGELGSIERGQMTTCCDSDTFAINRIYTEGYNLGLYSALDLIRKKLNLK